MYIQAAAYYNNTHRHASKITHTQNKGLQSRAQHFHKHIQGVLFLSCICTPLVMTKSDWKQI